MRRPVAVPLALAAACLLAAPAAAAPEPWLRIEVREMDPEPTRVSVNLPLALAETVLDAIETDALRHGRLVVHRDHDLDRSELRRVWAAVRDAPQGAFVTVRRRDARIDARRVGGHLEIRVRESEPDPGTVDARIPVPVVTALLSGGRDELNLTAAIRALGTHGDGELVVVDERATSVRVWIERK